MALGGQSRSHDVYVALENMHRGSYQSEVTFCESTIDRHKLIYYARLTARTKYLLAVKLAAGLLAVTWAMNILADLVECRPIWLYWHVVKVELDCAVSLMSLFSELC